LAPTLSAQTERRITIHKAEQPGRNPGLPAQRAQSKVIEGVRIFSGEEHGQKTHKGNHKSRQLDEIKNEDVRQKQQRLWEQEQESGQSKQTRGVFGIISLDSHRILLHESSRSL